MDVHFGQNGWGNVLSFRYSKPGSFSHTHMATLSLVPSARQKVDPSVGRSLTPVGRRNNDPGEERIELSERM